MQRDSHTNAIREKAIALATKGFADLDPKRADTYDGCLDAVRLAHSIDDDVDGPAYKLVDSFLQQSQSYDPDFLPSKWGTFKPQESKLPVLLALAKQDREAGLSDPRPLEERGERGGEPPPDFNPFEVKLDPAKVAALTTKYLTSIRAAKGPAKPAVSAPPTKPPRTLDNVIAEKARTSGGTEAGRWQYSEEHWRVRFDLTDGKKLVLPLTRIDGELVWKAPATPWTLYNLPKLQAAPPDKTWHWPEGEKKATCLESLGYVATTTAGGALATGNTDISLASGRDIVLWRDNDLPGSVMVRALLARLATLSPRPRVRVIDPPDVGEAGDIADFVAQRRQTGKSDDEIHVEIDALVAKAPYANLQEYSGALITEDFSNVEVQPVPWLRRGYLCQQQITLIAGPTSAGKSMLLMHWIACLTRGLPFFDEGPPSEPMSVLYFAPEDAKNILNMRLRAVGADLSRFRRISGFARRDAKTGNLNTQPFALPDGLPSLAHALAENPDIRVVILDPVTGAMLDADINDQSEVRKPLQELAAFAELHNIAIICTTHLNKNAGNGTALNRTLGSVAFQNLVRLMFLVVPNRQDDETKYLIGTKSNLGKKAAGRSYRVWESANPDIPNFAIVPGEVKDSPDKLLGDFEGSGKADKKADDVQEAIQSFLEDGEKPKEEVIEQIRRVVAGQISVKTVQRHADKIGVISEVRGNTPPKAYWSLPTVNSREQ